MNRLLHFKKVDDMEHMSGWEGKSFIYGNGIMIVSEWMNIIGSTGDFSNEYCKVYDFKRDLVSNYEMPHIGVNKFTTIMMKLDYNYIEFLGDDEYCLIRNILEGKNVFFKYDADYKGFDLYENFPYCSLYGVNEHDITCKDGIYQVRPDSGLGETKYFDILNHMLKYGRVK